MTSNFGQRSLFLKWAEVNVVTHYGEYSIGNKWLDRSALNTASASPHLVLKEYGERGNRENLRAGWWEGGFWKAVFYCTHDLTAAMAYVCKIAQDLAYQHSVLDCDVG